MNRSFVFRIAQTLTIFGLLVVSLTPNLQTNAQDKASCKDIGWTPVNASNVDLSGTWASFQDRNCKESAAWKYPFSTTITKENNQYTGKVSDGTPLEIAINGSAIKFVRDMKGQGPDKDGNQSQIWKGKLETKDGRIRIYGTWSGAFAYLREETYNLDFMMIKN